MNRSNYQRQIIDYFKKNLSKGYTIDSLKWALVNQGYSKALVEKSIDEANKELAKQAPILKEKPKIKYEVVEEEKPVARSSWWKKIFGIKY